MDFSSIFFLWVFLPGTLSAVWLFWFLLRTDEKRQLKVSNAILLIFSLVFYSFAGFRSTLLLIGIVTVDYICGRYIAAADIKKRRPRLILSVVFNVLILAIFKYGSMLIVVIEGLLSVHDLPLKAVIKNVLLMKRTNAMPFHSIVMPLAISFVIFQSISYLVDVYKEKTAPETTYLYFFLYETAFFQLVQGPIIRYPDFSPQLKCRRLSIEKTVEGIRRFCFGLGKKVIIANTLAQVIDPVWEQTGAIGTADAWVVLIMYTFQIYFDFSGYSDMAVGLAKMFGFDICENFNLPYVSKSVQEFWRRWHISLSSWFKDYIYIPLGGNRRGNIRTLLNIFIVFLVTGIWHGANWTFICWGLWFAFISIIERVFLMKLLNKNPFKILNWVYTFIVVVFGWVLFRSPDMITAAHFFSSLFSVKESTAFYAWASYTDASVVIAFVAAVIFMGPVQDKYGDRYEEFRHTEIGAAVDGSAAMIILIISIILIINGSYSPSIYAGF